MKIKKVNYVRQGRIAKDLKWTYASDYGTLDITINRSKPEKDPKDIAAARSAQATSYPKCQLCPENAGFAGNLNHAARQNLRPVPMNVFGESWQLQYSPYGYYNEHCIVFNENHTAMKIDDTVFEKLFDILEYLPHYFVGSNADLPIVGGSILSHEHFQGGRYTFAMEKADRKTAFIGKVGDDTFGRQLAETVRQSGTDTTNLIFDDTVHTTLAFVHTFPDGEREFSFYRNPGADMMLKKEEVREDILKEAKIFHFGTLSSTHEGVREATRYAIETAKQNGALISFDPNLREPLWNTLDDARKEIAYGLSKCDILKISDNELEFMTGTKDYAKGVEMLRAQYDIKVIFVTLGKDGSRAYCKDKMAEQPTFSQIKPVEKTGAGDTFEGCALNYLLEHDIDSLSEGNLEELLLFANAGASLITTRKGALKVMPEKLEIKALIEKSSHLV